MANAIFISYRHGGSSPTVGRIGDWLNGAFGQANVFRDVFSIQPGVNFREYIADVLQSCRVGVVIIGPQWLGVDESGARRIDNPDDWVRIEVEGVLARGIRVIPVLVDGAAQLTAAELPESLKTLAELQSITVRPDGRDFTNDMQLLIDAIRSDLPAELMPSDSQPRATWPPLSQSGTMPTWPPQTTPFQTMPFQTMPPMTQPQPAVPAQVVPTLTPPPAAPPPGKPRTSLRYGFGAIVAVTLIVAGAFFYNGVIAARAPLVGRIGPTTTSGTGTAVASGTAHATQTAGRSGGPTQPGGGPAPTATPRPATLLWHYATGAPINSTPAVVGGTIYFTSEDHNIYAVSAGGGLLWHYQTGSELTASPTVVGGVLYAGSGDGFMYALNASNGSLIWKHGSGLSIVTNAAYANGIVYYEAYLSTTSFALYAIQASNNSQLWVKTLTQASNTPLVVGSTVYATSGTYLYALNGSNGSVMWSYNFTAGASDPVYSSGIIYASGDGKLVAFNATSGSILWQQAGLGEPTINNGIAYGLAGGGPNGAAAVYAVNASSGKLMWQTATSHGPWALVSYYNGVLYAHGADHELQAYSASNGQFLWEVSLKLGAVDYTMLPFSYPTASNGVVYVGSYDSNLYAYSLP